MPSPESDKNKAFVNKLLDPDMYVQMSGPIPSFITSLNLTSTVEELELTVNRLLQIDARGDISNLFSSFWHLLEKDLRTVRTEYNGRTTLVDIEILKSYFSYEPSHFEHLFEKGQDELCRIRISSQLTVDLGLNSWRKFLSEQISPYSSEDIDASLSPELQFTESQQFQDLEQDFLENYLSHIKKAAALLYGLNFDVRNLYGLTPDLGVKKRVFETLPLTLRWDPLSKIIALSLERTHLILSERKQKDVEKRMVSAEQNLYLPLATRVHQAHQAFINAMANPDLLAKVLEADQVHYSSSKPKNYIESVKEGSGFAHEIMRES